MAADSSSWQVVGASVVGTSHRRMSPPRGCDDAWGMQRLAPGALHLVAADGAGSASHAATGAQCVVETVLARSATFAERGFPADPELWVVEMRLMLEAAQGALAALVVAPATLADFATTLLTVVVTSSWVAALHVGDGASVVQGRDGTLAALTWPHKGGYANETIFMTSAHAREQAQIAVQPRGEIQGIALLTDGLEHLALDFAKHAPSPGFFSPLFAFAARTGTEHEKTAELTAFLDGERINERTDDDKTLVIAMQS